MTKMIKHSIKLKNPWNRIKSEIKRNAWSFQQAFKRFLLLMTIIVMALGWRWGGTRAPRVARARMSRARTVASAHARTGRRVHAAARVPRRVPAQLLPTKDDERDGELPCAYILYDPLPYITYLIDSCPFSWSPAFFSWAGHKVRERGKKWFPLYFISRTMVLHSQKICENKNLSTIKT